MLSILHGNCFVFSMSVGEIPLGAELGRTKLETMHPAN